MKLNVQQLHLLSSSSSAAAAVASAAVLEPVTAMAANAPQKPYNCKPQHQHPNEQQQQDQYGNDIVSKLLDVNIVDTYLLQTYIVPLIVDTIVALQTSLQQGVAALSTITTTTFVPQQSLNNNNEPSTTTGTSIDNSNNRYGAAAIISRIVSAVLPFITLLITNGYTPAMRIMNVQLRPASTRSTKDAKTTTACNTRESNDYAPQTYRRRLILYGILQYILPELIYPVLQYLLQGAMDKLQHKLLNSSHEPKGVTSDGNPHDSQKQQQQIQNHTAWQRQYDTLIYIQQNILVHFENKLLPMIRLLTLLLSWTARSSNNNGNGVGVSNISILLAGLRYNTIIPTTTLSHQSTSSFGFDVTMAHRRYITHHLWETIRIILLPSIVLIPTLWKQSTIQIQRHLTSSTITMRRIVRRAIRMKGTIQYSMTRTTTPNSTCPLCQQIPTTTAAVVVQASCTSCLHQQMYCYPCLYHHYIQHSNANENDAILFQKEQHHYYRLPIRQRLYCIECQNPIGKVKMVMSGI
jgi:hypothetical protein